MDTQSTCALLAEPHHGLAEGVRDLLATAVEAVVMVNDRTSLFEAAARLTPALAVIDLGLARPDIGAFMQRMRACCPAVPVIFIGVHDEASVARSAVDAGAAAFVAKGDIAARLMPAVDAVLRSARCRA